MIRYLFYVYQENICVVKGFCYSQLASRESAEHYAIQYRQDGPVKVKYRKVSSRS